MPTYTFAYDPREFYRAQRMVHRLVGGWTRWVFAAIYGLIVFVYIVPPALYGTFRWSLANFIPLAFITVLLLAVTPLTRWYVARTLPRRDPSLQGPQQRVLSDEGLQVRGAGVITSFQWAAIHRAVETADFLLLFFNPKCAHYLPKRAMPTPADLDQVRDLLRSKLGERFEQRGLMGAA